MKHHGTAVDNPIVTFRALATAKNEMRLWIQEAYRIQRLKPSLSRKGENMGQASSHNSCYHTTNISHQTQSITNINIDNSFSRFSHQYQQLQKFTLSSNFFIANTNNNKTQFIANTNNNKLNLSLIPIITKLIYHQC